MALHSSEQMWDWMLTVTELVRLLAQLLVTMKSVLTLALTMLVSQLETWLGIGLVEGLVIEMVQLYSWRRLFDS